MNHYVIYTLDFVPSLLDKKPLGVNTIIYHLKVPRHNLMGFLGVYGKMLPKINFKRFDFKGYNNDLHLDICTASCICISEDFLGETSKKKKIQNITIHGLYGYYRLSIPLEEYNLFKQYLVEVGFKQHVLVNPLYNTIINDFLVYYR